MEQDHRESAGAARARIERGAHDAAWFRSALARVPAAERDGWIDLVLGLGELPDDGPELPRDCVPYLPCAVSVLSSVIDRTPMDGSDVFVDVGSGTGRAAAVVHLLTGAPAIGIEIQPRLVRAARALAERLQLSRASFVEGDAAELTRTLPAGSVYFLYCPFGGERLARWLASIEPLARARPIRICCVDLLLPSRDWLALDSAGGELAIYRSTR
jgi:SAM-dependent methyltransferase